MGLFLDILKGVAIAAAAGAAVYAGYKIYKKITKKVVQDKVRECEDQFGKELYAEIDEIQPYKIKYTVYDDEGNLCDGQEIESEEGVDESLYVGQKIYA